MRKYPNLSEEKRLWRKGYKIVVGLDEAGRGPLAGPVVAGAVAILNTKYKIQNTKIRDSKQLTPKVRETLYKAITNDKNIWWGIGIVSEKIIDKINIKNAAELAMEKAFQGLIKKILISQKSHDRENFVRSVFLIIDGNQLSNLKLKIPQRDSVVPAGLYGALNPVKGPRGPHGTLRGYKLIIKADQKVWSCAAASILAKVTRDRIMMNYHKKYSQYRFDLHKGYPTKLHLKLLKKYGPCKIHRLSFAPVANLAK